MRASKSRLPLISGTTPVLAEFLLEAVHDRLSFFSRDEQVDNLSGLDAGIAPGAENVAAFEEIADFHTR